MAEPEWKRRERHQIEVTVLLGGDELDSLGRLRRWRGQQTLAKLATAGHTSVGFDGCACRFEVPNGR